jgi:hypothetical protein
MFQKQRAEKMKTNILYSITFFSKIVPFIRYEEKYSRAGQVTDGNMAHTH